MVLAVLERTVGLDLGNRDVFVNVAGGVEIGEPGADLALPAAIVSSRRRRALPPRWVFVGEIGLTGEIRAVARMSERLREACRLGFDTAVLPVHRDAEAVPGIEALHEANLRAAVSRLGEVRSLSD